MTIIRESAELSSKASPLEWCDQFIITPTLLVRRGLSASELLEKCKNSDVGDLLTKGESTRGDDAIR